MDRNHDPSSSSSLSLTSSGPNRNISAALPPRAGLDICLQIITGLLKIIMAISMILQMITGKEDAANNYARGHYTIGKEQIEVNIFTFSYVHICIFAYLHIVRRVSEDHSVDGC